MKKIYALFIAFTFASFLIYGQTASSIANGNWTNPLTWNCTCVPTSGYSVTINHNITLNTSLIFNSGGINVNSGWLVQDASNNRDIWVNGGYFNVNTSALSMFRYLLISSGTMSNTGSFTVSAFTNSVNITNAGKIQMDSMYVGGNFTNTPTGLILGDSLTNGSSFTNNGKMAVTWVTNNGNFKNYDYHYGYAFTNASVYENYDSLLLTGSIWNKATFYNKPSGKIELGKNFHNYNPSTTSVFDNDGSVKAYDSWYNTDTVKGSGSFIVADTSANSGFMKENFDFCDQTPPASAPYVDFNSGSISSGITWCNPTGVKELNTNQSFNLYPNPNNGFFFVDSKEAQTLTLSDEMGRVLKTIEVLDKKQVDINDLSPGFYFVSGKNYRVKVIVTK